jgi:prepilin-type N-terminal cleavage/methylation domain-containing protein
VLSLRTDTRFVTAAPHRGRKGFSLVELIVGLVLVSVLCTAILSMVTSQSRYVGQLNTDAQMVDQVRGANELLTTEIADLPRGAMLYARRDSVAYRLPVMWGVICGPVNRQLLQANTTKPRKGEAPLAPATKIAIEFEPKATVLGNPNPQGLAISGNGTSFTYYAVSNWSSLALVSTDSAGLSCLDAVATATKKKKVKANKALPTPPTATVIESAEDYYETTQMGVVFGKSPAERSLIFGYVEVSYYLKPSGGNGAMALYRSTATGPQKLAWPFASSSGFTYRLDDNTTSTTVSEANIARVRAVRVDLPVTRAARNDRRADTLLVQPWIPLYNAR